MMEGDKDQRVIYGLLLEENLEAFYLSLRTQLHVYKVEDLMHVTRKDLSSIGILSGPDVRRFEKVIGKVTKNAGLKGIFTKVLPKKQKQLIEIPAAVRLWEEFEPVIIKSEDLLLTDILGAGNFGEVYKGSWTRRSGGHEAKIPVAVKCLKENSNQSFIKEVSILSQLDQKHDNIIKLYGICIQDEVIKMVTEFAEQGSLLEKLEKGEIRMVPLLCQFAVQIASGMMYLEQKGLVHRDLAARNILVTAHNQVKISDFGLAKLVDNKNQWVMTAVEALPIRWLAIESLLEGRFTSASDVWSYGVVLWEMFSFGKHPWGSFASKEVVDKVTSGERLKEPEFCPSNIYSIIMRRCWLEDPQERIKFEEARNSLISIQPTSGFAVSSNKNEGTLKYTFGDIIVALKPFEGNPDVWVGQNERTLEFGTYVKSETQPILPKIPFTMTPSINTENDQHERPTGNIFQRERSKPISIVANRKTSPSSHHPKQSSPASQRTCSDVSEIDQRISASCSPRTSDRELVAGGEFSPRQNGDLTNPLTNEPVYSSIDDTLPQTRRVSNLNESEPGYWQVSPNPDRLASGTAMRYPSLYMKMKARTLSSEEEPSGDNATEEEQKPALPPKSSKRLSQLSPDRNAIPESSDAPKDKVMPYDTESKGTETKQNIKKPKPQKPPRTSHAFYFDDASLQDVFHSEHGTNPTVEGIYENTGVFELDPSGWAQEEPGIGKNNTGSDASKSQHAIRPASECHESGTTLSISNMILKLHIPNNKQNSFERMKKLRKAQSLESVNIDFSRSNEVSSHEGSNVNLNHKSPPFDEPHLMNPSENPFASGSDSVSYVKLENDSNEEMSKKRSLFGLKLRRKSRKEQHIISRPANFLPLYEEMKRAIPEVTQREGVAALEVSNWNVEEAIKYLKLSELLNLGLCPEATCLDMLKTYDWDVLEASYAIKIHYLMAIHLDLSLEKAAKLLRENRWHLQVVLNSLRKPSYLAECEEIGYGTAEAERTLAAMDDDFEKAICELKVKRVMDITQKPELLCRGTLEHCQWKLERAVAFIIESE